jgi:hypothetical protein
VAGQSITVKGAEGGAVLIEVRSTATASSTGFGKRRQRCHLNGSTATSIAEDGRRDQREPAITARPQQCGTSGERHAGAGVVARQTGANLTAVGNAQGSYTYMTVEYLCAIT